MCDRLSVGHLSEQADGLHRWTRHVSTQTLILPVDAITQDAAVGRSGTARVWFQLAGIALLVYVALCTSNRDSSWGADAWEHHRAVLALTRDLWNPANPTYATPEASIRYSPYSVALALLCRTTGLDAYHALSVAAVFNTGLLLAGLLFLLRTYHAVDAAFCVLVVMVGLYGTVPGYANSYALADLPWHQVNPSALVFALGLFMWASLRCDADQPHNWLLLSLLSVAGAIGMLSHPHTGVFVFLGLLCVAATAPAKWRGRLILRVSAVAAATLLLCLAWPWFSFLQAVRSNQDSGYWFNAFILKIAMLEWCGPALLLWPLLLSLRGRPLVRFCLFGAAVCYGLGLLAFVTRSSVLARMPLPALFLLHVPIGLYIHEHRLLQPATWRGMLRDLASMDLRVSAPAYARLLVLVLLAFCLVPQMARIPQDPLLARAYVAPRLGKADKQLELRSVFARFLQPVGERDVVLSDAITAWPIPSFHGRIVAGLHYEAFTPDQPQRDRDVRAFFETRSEPIRQDVLDRYHVRWILLNTTALDEAACERLLEPQAVVSRVAPFILMDADRWRDIRRARPLKQPSEPTRSSPDERPLSPASPALLTSSHATR